jgi:hypothetical protein
VDVEKNDRNKIDRKQEQRESTWRNTRKERIDEVEEKNKGMTHHPTL